MVEDKFHLGGAYHMGSENSSLKSARTVSHLSMVDAAYQVLSDTGKPLNYQLITKLAIQRGIIKTKGLTPEKTLGARVRGEIKSREKNGLPPRFRALGKGKYGLYKWYVEPEIIKIEDKIAKLVEDQRKATKREFLNKLLEVKPPIFEEMMGLLFEEMGYENVEVTKRSNDGGIDIIADVPCGVTKIRTVVQVKRWKNNIQRPTIDQLRGSLYRQKALQGVIITTSNFSEGSKIAASEVVDKPIKTISGEELIEKMVEYGVGLREQSFKGIYISTDFFDGESE